MEYRSVPKPKFLGQDPKQNLGISLGIWARVVSMERKFQELSADVVASDRVSCV